MRNLQRHRRIRLDFEDTPISLAIWWIRRDLRLTDNAALSAAAHEHDAIVPLFILDPALLNSERLRGPRSAWLFDGLRELGSDLAKIGGRLIVREGQPTALLIEIAKAIGASAVYFNRDYSPFAMARNRKVRSALESAGIAVYDFKDVVIHEAGETLTAAGGAFSVYSPYRRAWNALPKPSLLPMPSRLDTPAAIDSLPIPAASDFGSERAEAPIAEPGERLAIERLNAFVADGIYGYAARRNSPGIDGTSILSPYLRWGMVSPRQCYWAAHEAFESATTKDARASVETWIGELVWREFYYQVLARNPHVVRGAYRPAYDAITWEDRPEYVAAWQRGLTGYPIVDAAMRQLNRTGWMHNRTRMIVASFLCKDLLIDWRIGERYFMTRLLDGDLANNNGGWQWTAGTGTDAAPYFRIFNPTTQGQKFDPAGDYIRRWLPELSRVPDASIHEPATMPRALQDSIGCVIGRDYPAPIVDHGVQRDRALALYQVAKNLPPP